MNENRDTLQGLLGVLGFGSSAPTFGSQPISVNTEQTGDPNAKPNETALVSRNKLVIIGGVAVAGLLLYLYFKRK